MEASVGSLFRYFAVAAKFLLNSLLNQTILNILELSTSE